MPLLRLRNAALHLGPRVLLDHIDLNLKRGERVGLLGRNGEGKTTLLRVVAGELALEDGERWLRPEIKVAQLEQVLPAADDTLVYDVVAGGLAEAGELLASYHHLIASGSDDMAKLARVQEALEAKNGWSLQQKVDTIISQLELPADSRMSELSGGWRRRVALGRALVCEPDILLLDEPTNHLDIPAIEWLEQFLMSYPVALLFVTHDRSFLRRVANRIVELDRGQLYSWQGDYSGYLVYREERLSAEDRANELFDKRLADEEVWIRQGIKARRTRNEGRVRALEAMRRERGDRRVQQGKATFTLDSAEKSGKIVVEAEHISMSFDGVTIIRDFSTIIQRGDRIGLVGPNGAGKSTLLKLLLGELAPQLGKIKFGTKLEVAYFDQLRQQLDPEANLIDNVCGGRDFIDIDGKPRHAISYLGDFLFSPERVRTPVKALSGGEQARAILAKLFSQPANVLVLDEPTNDLDMETLELLEELLLNFNGTVLLVSHDREFMDNVVTSIMVLPGDGSVSEHVGGYADLQARGGSMDLPQPVSPKRVETAKEPPAARKKLSYKDQRELDAMPALTDQLEAEHRRLEQLMAAPDFYQRERGAINDAVAALAAVQQQLDAALERWAELEDASGT